MNSEWCIRITGILSPIKANLIFFFKKKDKKRSRFSLSEFGKKSVVKRQSFIQYPNAYIIQILAIAQVINYQYYLAKRRTHSAQTSFLSEARFRLIKVNDEVF
jgi:hypothetical protein